MRVPAPGGSISVGLTLRSSTSAKAAARNSKPASQPVYEPALIPKQRGRCGATEAVGWRLLQTAHHQPAYIITNISSEPNTHTQAIELAYSGVWPVGMRTGSGA